jgi:hypothetical protein
LLLDSSRLAGVKRLVAASDFEDQQLATTFSIMTGMMDRGLSIDLTTLVDELERRGKVTEAGGLGVVGALVDYEPAAFLADDYALRVRRRALTREAQAICERGTWEELDEKSLARLNEINTILRQLSEGQVEGESRISASAFTGDSLLRLADRPALPPIDPGVPPTGHLTLLIAPKGYGKTSLSLTLAGARACGTRPWEGAQAPEGAGRVLVITPDEPPEAAARRLRGLSVFTDEWSLDRAAGNLEVVGPDRDVPGDLLECLRLNDAGLKALEEALVAAEGAGRPFVGVHLDAWVDFLPEGASENDNALVARIAGHLEAFAVRFNCYVLLLHHEGKPNPNSSEGRDPRFAGRGASSLNAKARAVYSLEMVSGARHIRRIRTVTNLAPCPKPAAFEVCSPDAEREELLFWRPTDELAQHSISDYLAPDEAISTNELAWRLSGREPTPNADPPGDARRLAVLLRKRWVEDGCATAEAGARNAKMIRRLP